MNLRKPFISAALGATLLASPIAGLAQSSTESGGTIDATVRAGLAASALSAENLPTGFTFAGETFLNANDLGTGGLDAATLTDTGFATQYVSVYTNPDAGTTIRSYISSWSDAAAAEEGFAFIEDESVVAPDATLADSDASVGEEPRETTTGSYPGVSGGTVGTVDITFRRDNLVAGVALETSDGSEPDAEVAGQLASQLDERVQTVLSGESPAHTDLELPGQALSFASEGQVAQAGFLGPIEVESIYGAQGSVLTGVNASWVESTFLGDSVLDSPSVTIGITTFGSPEDAAATVEQSADLFMSLANQQPVDGAALEGADVVRAFRFSGASSDGATLDSYRTIFATDNVVTVVDVQSAGSDADAADAANAIATAQLGCQSGAGCELPELPAGFLDESE